jgi:glycosyltransferase involved in cell wall biosynthesis
VVHASTSPEPFGLVVAEAMAAGCAVVVSDDGGVRELVQPEYDALTYRACDQASLSVQLERLIVDAPLRRRLGLVAHEAAVERFNPSRVGDQMIGLYKQFNRAAAA